MELNVLMFSERTNCIPHPSDTWRKACGNYAPTFHLMKWHLSIPHQSFSHYSLYQSPFISKWHAQDSNKRLAWRHWLSFSLVTSVLLLCSHSNWQVCVCLRVCESWHLYWIREFEKDEESKGVQSRCETLVRSSHCTRGPVGWGHFICVFCFSLFC